MLLKFFTQIDMENSASSLILPSQDNYSNFLSTGYLEDALIEFSVRFKRRRLMLCSDDEENDDTHDHYASLDDLSFWANWSENYSMQSGEDFSHASLLTHDMHYGPGLKMEKSAKEMRDEAVNFFPEVKTLFLEQEGISSTPKTMEMNSSYSTSTGLAHYNYSSDTYSTDSSSISDERDKISKRKAVMTASTAGSGTAKKMVYPFGLVKPGGEEGDITLKDINKRILMPPSRPLKHPVGVFACRPGVSPHGPGLSGKEVVALTRIHTQGRGTITIIRTKG
uniref:Protein XRI1 n=1 Tax=Opuntia streptacantha TaxID=393608 RepID=A0A7C8ZYG3_OPUST